METHRVYDEFVYLMDTIQMYLISPIYLVSTLSSSLMRRGQLEEYDSIDVGENRGLIFVI